MYFFILLFTVILLGSNNVQAARPTPFTASTSDGGRLAYRGGALYASANLDEIDKVHMVISIATCECVAAADVQKMNQLDYMLDRGHLFSYSVYVNEGGFHDRSACSLTHENVAKRTDLKFGVISGDGLGVDEAVRPLFAKRIEGAVLLKGIEEFNAHPYIKENSREIFGTDKSGGILLTQGNVELRPCMLFPWYMPWIYDDYNNYHLVNISNPATAPVYYEEEDMVMFKEIVADMIHAKVIKQKHLDNLEDNTGAVELVKMFSFQAMFLPHRFSKEFASLLKPFADTQLSPFVYVPYVMQLMFDHNEWLHFIHATHNETLRLGTWPLLVDCAGATVAEMQVYDRAASDLHYYAYGWCGGDSFYVVVEKVVTEIEMYTGVSVYRLLFFLLLAMVLFYITCAYRRPIFECARTMYRRNTHPSRSARGYELQPPLSSSLESDDDEDMVINPANKENS